MIQCRVIKPNQSKKSNQFNSTTLDVESLLTQYGYTVQANKLTETQRHTILQNLIDNNIISSYGIRNHLEWLIWLHSPQKDSKWVPSIEKWNNDIYFVDEYVINTPDGIYVHKLKN